MPVLTAPPPPELELPRVSFFGRSLNEYAQFFSLDLAALRGRAVLDVAAGPSSFTAEACRREIDAVAVDPMYGVAPDVLAAQIEDDYAKMFAQMRAKPRLFRTKRVTSQSALEGGWSPARPTTAAARGAIAAARPPCYFSSIDEAEADRRAAAQRFLADYEAHAVHSRYVCAALPRLPFFDGAFDLVLCAHLLFTYARRFDFDWHLAACRELARVSAGEVRLHPVCGPDGKRYPELERLQRELLARGVVSRLVSVPYTFFVGSGTMLVLNPATA